MMESELVKRLLVSLMLALVAAAIIYGAWLICTYVMRTIAGGIVFVIFCLLGAAG